MLMLGLVCTVPPMLLAALMLMVPVMFLVPLPVPLVRHPRALPQKGLAIRARHLTPALPQEGLAIRSCHLTPALPQEGLASLARHLRRWPPVRRPPCRPCCAGTAPRRSMSFR